MYRVLRAVWVLQRVPRWDLVWGHVLACPIPAREVAELCRMVMGTGWGLT